MAHQFKAAPMDKTGKIVTGIAIIGTVCTLGFGLIWLILYLFSPRSYTVSPQGIVVRTPVTSYVIPVHEIMSINIVGYAKPGVGLTWYSGLFGYASLFALANGSVARVYAASWERMVCIQIANGDPYLLSPAEPEIFVDTVKGIIMQR